MFGGLAKSIFGSSNDRYVKSLGSIVQKIAAFEPQLQALSDEELAGQTAKFREQLANGTKLDDLLPEAFATVREAAVRVLGMRHFDVQMIGGIVLHRGEIAEMRTGEGKTLVATLATYLNALPGDGVHVITVNDYLAARDAEWMHNNPNHSDCDRFNADSHRSPICPRVPSRRRPSEGRRTRPGQHPSQGRIHPL